MEQRAPPSVWVRRDETRKEEVWREGGKGATHSDQSVRRLCRTDERKRAPRTAFEVVPSRPQLAPRTHVPCPQPGLRVCLREWDEAEVDEGAGVGTKVDGETRWWCGLRLRCGVCEALSTR